MRGLPLPEQPRTLELSTSPRQAVGKVLSCDGDPTLYTILRAGGTCHEGRWVNNCHALLARRYLAVTRRNQR
jgi:hypothetical protein